LKTQRTLAWKSLQAVARPLTNLLFDLKVYGQRNVPATGGVLLVSNHQSYLDPMLLGVHLKRPLNYIAKSELFKHRLGGWFLRSVLNSFPVRQGAGDVGAIKETIRRLEEGHLLNIYPEGSRTSNGQIAPLQKGVALIIRRAKKPVIPVAIVGSYEAWPMHRRVWQPSPIRIRYGTPIELADLSSDEILATIDRTLRNMVCELKSQMTSLN
jgi:1-acyl-sn-glycerol-3-phosphate acyltransferase